MVAYEITPLHLIRAPFFSIAMPCCNEIAEQLQGKGTLGKAVSTFAAILAFF